LPVFFKLFQEGGIAGLGPRKRCQRNWLRNQIKKQTATKPCLSCFRDFNYLV